MKGKVYLLGAGCGEMNMITMRGMELLRHCDAVVYDDLIDDNLLREIPDAAERFYMGKRLGQHSAAQSEICGKLVELCAKGMMVVRLKGGDAFVFGRGGEEALALQEAGMDFEVIPGISSCIAIPEEAGIPVTHRGLSRSFHVVTAHTKEPGGKLPAELVQLAKVDGTIVILMGLSRLRQIAETLIAEGKAPEVPAAVISGGNTAHPAVVRASLSKIADAAAAAAVQAPAVIVIGEVAALELKSLAEGNTEEAAETLGLISSGSDEKPLSGICVGLTGTDTIQDKLRNMLTDLGADVYAAGRSIVVPREIPNDVWKSLFDEKPHWIVFTSANGVRCFFRMLRVKMQALRLDSRRLASWKFAVIGKASGAALEAEGFFPDLCPASYTGSELAKALLAEVKQDEDVWLMRSARGSRELREMLENGLSSECRQVMDVPVYDLDFDEYTKEAAAMRLSETDYLTFSSSSGVEKFFEDFKEIPAGAKCVCIGSVTAETLGSGYGASYLMASEISAAGIVDEILRDAGK